MIKEFQSGKAIPLVFYVNNKTIYFACAAGQSIFSSRLDKSSYLPVPLLLIVLNDNQKYKVI